MNIDYKLEEMLKEKSTNEWLNPNQREFSEAEHKLALSRFVFDTTITDYLFNIKQYVEYVKNKHIDNSIIDEKEQELFNQILNDVEKCDTLYWNKEVNNLDFLDIFIYNDVIPDYLKRGLTTQHIGDCTAHPVACDRCLAEHYYKIDNTAKWDKRVGYKLVQLQTEQK